MDLVRRLALGILAAAALHGGARADPLAPLIAEAAARFELPESWLRAVMQAESAGRVRAVSPAGAMGLMQVMPATYAELRRRYGLGPDPFEPRDNILAGAAYLREMFDRYGAPGFLAAYNAGPARLDDHLLRGRPLPAETRRYVAGLAPKVATTPAPPDPAASGLFAVTGDAGSPPASIDADGLFVALGAAASAE